MTTPTQSLTTTLTYWSDIMTQNWDQLQTTLASNCQVTETDYNNGKFSGNKEVSGIDAIVKGWQESVAKYGSSNFTPTSCNFAISQDGQVTATFEIPSFGSGSLTTEDKYTMQADGKIATVSSTQYYEANALTSNANANTQPLTTTLAYWIIVINQRWDDLSKVMTNNCIAKNVFYHDGVKKGSKTLEGISTIASDWQKDVAKYGASNFTPNQCLFTITSINELPAIKAKYRLPSFGAGSLNVEDTYQFNRQGKLTHIDSQQYYNTSEENSL